MEEEQQAPAADTAVPADETSAPETTATVESKPAVNDAPADSLLTFIDPDGFSTAIAAIILAIVLSAVARRALANISERFVGRRLLIKQLGTLLGFAIYLVAGLVAGTSVLNLSSEAVLALSGSLAVTLGFALKDFAASLLASLTILITRPFQVGDRINFGEYYGEVREIGLRSVQLVTLDDNLVTIPSNKLLTEAVANANAGALDCMVVIPFWVDADTSIVKAKEIVHEAILSSRYLYLGKPFNVLGGQQLIDGLGAVTTLTAKAYVYDARQEKVFASDVTEMVLEQFRSEGIKVPKVASAAAAKRTGAS